MLWLNICFLSELFHDCFPFDMTVDCKTVCQTHMGNVFWRLVHVYVWFMCVCNIPPWDKKKKAVMCLRSTPYHQILQQSTFIDFFAISTKLIILLRLTLKKTKKQKLLWSFLLCWTPVNKKCTFYFTHSLEQSHTSFLLGH